KAADGEAEERILTLCRIASGIATIRRWTYRLRQGRKPKTAEPKHDEKHCGCLIKLDQSIHSSSFLSFPPLSCFSGIAGPEETKNRAGRNLRLIQDPVGDGESGENLAS